MLTMSLPQDLERRLRIAADAAGVSVADLAQMALREWLEDLEDARDADAVMASPRRRWSQSDLERGLDLDD